MPLKTGKSWLYEGGVRVPVIVVKRLSAELDRFLAEVAVAPPRPNPDYDPQGPSLQSWVAKACQVNGTEAGLRIRPQGSKGFLAVTNLAQLGSNGPVTLRMSVRCLSDGQFACQWRSAAQESFPGEGQVVQVPFSGCDQPQEVAVDLPVAGTLQHIRIYFPDGADAVDLQSIELSAKGTVSKRIRRWVFGEW